MILPVTTVGSSANLYEMLKRDISAGAVEERLPSITQLCRLYDVSHCTVKKALDNLKANQYVVGQKGKGLFVNKAAIANPLFQKNIIFYLHIETMSNPYYLKILAKIRELLNPHECLVHFVNTSDQLKKLGFIPDVIILSELVNESEIEDVEVICGHKNIIHLNDSAYNYNIIGTDNYRGGYQAAEYLYKMGHRHIGVISRDLKYTNGFFSNRFNGFRDFVSQQAKMHCYDVEVDMEAELDLVVPLATEKLLVANPEITAIFAFTDTLALGVYSYCSANSLNIPDDISILSFDNQEFSGLLFPGLTTFQEDSEQIALLVNQLILQIITKQKNENMTLVEPFLIERKSVSDINH